MEQHYQAVTVVFVCGSRLKKELGLHSNGISRVWDHLVVKTPATSQRYLSIIEKCNAAPSHFELNCVELILCSLVKMHLMWHPKGDDKLKPNSWTLTKSIDGFSWTVLGLQ